MLKKAALIVSGTLLVVACGRNYTPSSPSQVPENGSSSASGAASDTPTELVTPLVAQAQGGVGFGFNGVVSGFPTGKVFLSGGGHFGSGFAKSSGGFSCLEDVEQGPLNVSINPDDPGRCLAGQGVRWDTAQLLGSTTFKCTGAAGEQLKTATTSDTRVVLQADFYRAGDANDESFTAQMIVSATDIAADISGTQNLWVQGVGCGDAIVHFSH